MTMTPKDKQDKTLLFRNVWARLLSLSAIVRERLFSLSAVVRQRLFSLLPAAAQQRLFDLWDLVKDYARIPEEKSLPPEIEAGLSDPKRTIFLGLIVVGIFFGVGGLFISLTEINGAVIAPGTVKVATERKTVQHLEGGIVKEILVKNGDLVRLGQPLVILESSRVSAAVAQLQGQLSSLLIIRARLLAEKELQETVAWPLELTDAAGNYINDDLATLVESENKLFVSRWQALKSEVTLLDKQVGQINEQILSFNERRQAEDQIIGSLNEEIEAKMVLYRDRFIDKSLILALNRRLAEHEGTKAQLKGVIAERREKIAEIKIRLNSLYNDFTKRAAGQLAEVDKQLPDLRERLRPLEDARKRLTVTAPIGGEIVGLNVHSVGGVVPSGAPILDIVPEHSELLVECKIQVRDIAKVYKGQKADVELSAFNNRTKTKITGLVTYISADREIQRTAYGIQPYYVVHLVLDRKELGEAQLYMSAGMPAAVYIITKPRTILSYMLEPLSQNFEPDDA